MPTQIFNGVELYYEVHGSGPSLLLIHGLGSSTRDWERQIPVFAERFRVVAFDCRGHGRSAKPTGRYSVPLFAADTAALIGALKIAPTHVVGHSMGGMIALQLALDAPQLIDRLVLVNTGPDLTLDTIKLRWTFLLRRLVVRFLGMRQMGKMIAKHNFPRPDQQALRQRLIDRWAENDKRAYLASLRAIVGWSVAERIGAIERPVLIITGDADYTSVAYKRAYAERMRNARLRVIADSRHLTPQDQPEAFNRCVMEFLAGNGTGTR